MMSRIYGLFASLLHKKGVLLVLAALGLAAATVGSATVLRAAPSPDSALVGVSNTGTLVAIAPTADMALRRAVRNGEAAGLQYLLDARGDRAFYRIENGSKPDCFAVGPTGPAGYHFGAIQCANFPSAEQPVLPFVLVRGAAGSPPSLWRSEGIAADGVARMALQDASGKLVARTPVEGNVFRFESIPDGSAALVGMDSAHKVVYFLPLSLG
jgi:hypothetical protein